MEDLLIALTTSTYNKNLNITGKRSKFVAKLFVVKYDYTHFEIHVNVDFLYCCLLN